MNKKKTITYMEWVWGASLTEPMWSRIAQPPYEIEARYMFFSRLSLARKARSHGCTFDPGVGFFPTLGHIWCHMSSLFRRTSSVVFVLHWSLKLSKGGCSGLLGSTAAANCGHKSPFSCRDEPVFDAKRHAMVEKSRRVSWNVRYVEQGGVYFESQSVDSN